MPVPLPVGTRLLHIGPQKTGTTTLQGAFHTNREALAAHGVHYAGKHRQARLAAVAVVFGESSPLYDESSLRRWQQLVDEVQGSDSDRVVISAEMFADSGPAQAREIVEAFGPDTHVVVTLRPLVKLLPSQWQQYVQTWATVDYPTWLDSVLNGSQSGEQTPSFWGRHRHDELIRRWADIVGPDRVTVVALDENDHGMVLRSFESLLDLPDGLLTPDGKQNRSLTLAEAELAREISRQFRERGWPREIHEPYVRIALYDRVKQRPAEPDAPAIATPQWALERADAMAVEIIAGIRESGVEVIGDLANLRVATSGPLEAPTADTVSIGLAAHAVLSMLDATVMRRRERAAAAAAAVAAAKQQHSIDGIPTRAVLGQLWGRTRRRVRRPTR